MAIRKRKPKQPPRPTEYEEQCAVIRWARMMAHHDFRLALLHGDSSGVRVPIGTAMKMKKVGAIKGWPDLFLACKSDGFRGSKPFGGLFIEMKRRKGSYPDNNQLIIHEELRKQGYSVHVCRGSDEAIRCIKEYLGMED